MCPGLTIQSHFSAGLPDPLQTLDDSGGLKQKGTCHIETMSTLEVSLTSNYVGSLHQNHIIPNKSRTLTTGYNEQLGRATSLLTDTKQSADNFELIISEISTVLWRSSVKTCIFQTIGEGLKL